MFLLNLDGSRLKTLPDDSFFLRYHCLFFLVLVDFFTDFPFQLCSFDDFESTFILVLVFHYFFDVLNASYNLSTFSLCCIINIFYLMRSSICSSVDLLLADIEKKSVKIFFFIML